jgi:hypothetical protein
MKKLVIVVLLSIVASAAFAQAEVSLGLKVGANFSKFNEEEADNLTSFHGGAFVLFKLTKIGIQPELLFSQQGASIQDVDLKTAYMTIPVMLKIYLVQGFNIQLGPQFGFLTKAELDGSDVKESFKNSDLSANVGLGIDLPFGLTVDGRYNIGLSDVGDDPSLPELKSQVIQVSVGYKLFKFGK